MVRCKLVGSWIVILFPLVGFRSSSTPCFTVLDRLLCGCKALSTRLDQASLWFLPRPSLRVGLFTIPT